MHLHKNKRTRNKKGGLKKHTRHNKKRLHKQRKHKRTLRGGMKQLSYSSLDKPIFVPKGVPFVPPGGGSSTGNAFPHKYYNLAQPDLSAPNNFLVQSYGTQPQSGGNIPILSALGRNISYHAQNVYNTYMGQHTPVSSNPNVLKQPIVNERQKYDIQPLRVDTLQHTSDVEAANFK